MFPYEADAAGRRWPALSIRAPWWWFILYADKRHENRDWPHWYRDREMAKLRATKGAFLIHAAKGCTQTEFDEACGFAADCGVTRFPEFASIARGGIVGRGVITGFVEAADSPWFVGPGALVIAEPIPLPLLPCRGALGFFQLPGYPFPGSGPVSSPPPCAISPPRIPDYS
ncbi:MAG: hypothetical protein PHE83_16785 [Opitutaceae bacterium]|nr:hypothetical protein [Opitutaceae bacterium]